MTNDEFVMDANYIRSLAKRLSDDAQCARFFSKVVDNMPGLDWAEDEPRACEGNPFKEIYNG